MANKKIAELLGDQADSLLNHECKTISKKEISLPMQIMWMTYGEQVTGTIKH